MRGSKSQPRNQESHSPTTEPARCRFNVVNYYSTNNDTNLWPHGTSLTPEALIGHPCIPPPEAMNVVDLLPGWMAELGKFTYDWGTPPIPKPTRPRSTRIQLYTGAKALRMP